MYVLILVFVFLLPYKLDSHGALGSSDVVILLHGFPTSSYDWNKVRDENCSSPPTQRKTTVLWTNQKPETFHFFPADLGGAHSALPPSHRLRLPGVRLQRQASEWNPLFGSVMISVILASVICFLHDAFSLTFPSGLTSTPYSSRPVWWKRWWLTWVSATSGWTWCPTTMETRWPWSCSTGRFLLIYFVNYH